MKREHRRILREAVAIILFVPIWIIGAFVALAIFVAIIALMFAIPAGPICF